MRPQKPYWILPQWLEKVKVSQDTGDFPFFLKRLRSGEKTEC